ncbi:MAG: AMP-binding protein [Gammaproteobacteria bacterium]
MDKIWLKNYPKGVVEEIDPGQYASLKALMEEVFARHADRPAFSSFGQTMSYGELDRASAAFGAYLCSELGLAAGDRVALVMPNILQFPVALYGALRAGLVTVNFNPLYTHHEMQRQLQDCGARVAIVMENFAHTLEQALEETAIEHVIVTRLADLIPGFKGRVLDFGNKYLKRNVPAWQFDKSIGFRDCLARGRNLELPVVEIGPDTLACLQYTGGTTGTPKGAELTHGNLVANLLQLAAWVGELFTEGEEKIITALPLYHIFALTVNALLMLRFGGENVLVIDPRDLKNLVKTLDRTRWTALTGVNTLFNALLNNERFTKLDFSAVKFTLGGGMAVQRVVAERWKKLTGEPLIEGYGLSETSPVVSANPLDIKDYTGSIGLPLPSTDISIRDDDGKELALGEEGELCVAGPQVMRRYWNRPEETAKAMTDDGFFRTGDVAKVDERGFIFLVDRKKDMIVVSGFNVYPNEVEDTLAAMPGVKEVAVIGVPDEHSNEAVKAFIVKSDASLDEKAVIAWTHENLAGYKIPKHVEFRDELPKSNVGKVLRRALRDEENGKRKQSEPENSKRS